MNVKTILAAKGDNVVSIEPTANLAAAAKLLSTHRIGAVVIRGAGGRLAGILSERDIVRALARFLQREHLRMRLAGALMPGGADDLVVAHDDAPHAWIRARGVQPAARQPQGMRHVAVIGGIHASITNVRVRRRGRGAWGHAHCPAVPVR